MRMAAFVFFFQAEDGIRDVAVTGVQTCALPIWAGSKSNASWKFQFSCERERRFRRGGTRKSHKKSDRAIAPHGRWTLVRPPQGFGAFDCAPRSLPGFRAICAS